MADNNKYLSKIVKEKDVLYIKDSEARAMIKPTASIAEVTAAVNELT